MSEPRSRKRARADSNVPSASGGPGDRQDASFTKDQKFWYQDGSIILLAQNIGFKVYRGLLAEQSEIFRDLFMVPQPSETQSVEDCALVHLSDTAEDLRALLSVMIHGRKCAGEDGDRLENILAWARMSHKYHIQDLLEYAIQRLGRYYPDKFTDFEDNDLDLTPQRHAIAAVNLARIADAPTVLPIAFYHCCTLESLAQIRGSPRADGTVDCLAPEDVVRCIEGREKLAGQAALCLSRICRTTVSDTGYVTHPLCELAITRLHDILAKWVGTTDALFTWRVEIDVELQRHPELSTLCMACRDILYERDITERKRVWKELPSWFGISIDGWGKCLSIIP